MTRPEAGTILDQRYELTAPTSDRGLGESWDARDSQHNGRVVCVKLLRPLPNGEAALPRDLADHLKALRSFRHDDILTIINHGVWDGRPFLVHDRFDGRSVGSMLDDARRAGSLPELALIEALFDRVCRVLHAAHRAPRALFHLGITPGCVLYQGEAAEVSVRLVDFGLARHADRDPTAPVRSARALHCPAPEQLGDGGAKVGALTDVFGLGGLLREMLSLPPQLGLTLSPAGLERRRDDVPDALWEVVARAMSPRPDDRFPSADALREAAARAWREPLRPRIEPRADARVEAAASPVLPVTAAAVVASTPLAALPLSGPMPSPTPSRALRPLDPAPPATPAFVREAAPAPAPEPDDRDFGSTLMVESKGLEEFEEPSRSSVTAVVTFQPAPIGDHHDTQEMPPREELMRTVAISEPDVEDRFARTMAVDQDALQSQVAAAPPQRAYPDTLLAASGAPPLVYVPQHPLPPSAAPVPYAPPTAPRPGQPTRSAPVPPQQSARYKLVLTIGILFIPVLLGLLLIFRARH